METPQRTSMTSTFYTRFGKRLVDLLLSFAGLALLSPFLLLVAVAVRLSSPGPALFRQIRTGQFGRPFRILKFRTMRQSPSGSLVTAAGDSRVVPLGRWLRSSKIDELPQLFNVLAGDMSLVGPRPEVPFYTERYSQEQKQVFLAKPGITGPSIIMDEEKLMAGQADKESFYVSTVMPAKLEIDLIYSKNVRFGGDVRMIFATLARLGGKLASVVGVVPPRPQVYLGKISGDSQRQTTP